MAQIGPTLFEFVASLIVVSIATYASTATLTDSSSYVHSLITAVLTSAVWFAVTFVTGGTFVIAGPLLAVVAYVVIVNWRYPGGWARAGAITVVTWIATFVILYALAAVGFSSFQALGVPPGI
jgi:heme/copper-type cytochrome/quinol oxidase subunit 2